jgi:hypothetical protein
LALLLHADTGQQPAKIWFAPDESLTTVGTVKERLNLSRSIRRTAAVTLAFVAALALLVAQVGLAGAFTNTPVKSNGCCGSACPMHCCIGNDETPSSEPVPAVPAPSAGHQLHAALLTVLLTGFSAEPARACASVLPLDSAPFASPVPLYVRTHCFLI